MGFPRQEYWSRLPFPSPRDFLDLWIKLVSPALARQILYCSEPLGKPHKMGILLVFTSKGYYMTISSVQFSSVQSLSRVRLSATPWTAASQASLSITNSRSSLKFTSIESVMPSSHLILCRPVFLLPPIPPSIRVFSNESTLEVAKVLEFQL